MVKRTSKKPKPITIYNGYNECYSHNIPYSSLTLVKGYRKNGKFIGYQENYPEWNNKGIKYIL